MLQLLFRLFSWILLGSDQAERKAIRWAMPPLIRDRAQPIDELLVRPGPQLANLVRSAVRHKFNLVVFSDPGSGKTVTILRELESLRRAGVIAAYVHLSATKSSTYEGWFQKSLTIGGDNGNPQMLMLDPPVKEVAEAAQEGGDAWVFLDEYTRGTAPLHDALLEGMETGTFLIGGKKVKLKLHFLIAANIPGGDATMIPLAPAKRSRQTKYEYLFTPDIDIMALLYMPLKLATHGAECGWPTELAAPPPETMRLIAAAWLLLNGWPLDRPCYAETPIHMLRLAGDLADADPELKAVMQRIVQLRTYRGPDPRKVLQLLLVCAGEAVDRAAKGGPLAISDEDILKNFARVMRAGFRHKLIEDKDRKELRELDQLAGQVIRRVFSSDKLRAIVADSHGPYSVASRLSGPAPTEEMAEVLWDYDLALRKRDPEAAPGHFRRFARLAAKLAEGGDLAELAVSGGWLRKDGKFHCLADRTLCEDFARLAEGTSLGEAFGAMAARDIAPVEELRDRLQASEKAWQFPLQFLAALRRQNDIRPRLAEAVEAVDGLLLGRTTQADPQFSRLLRRIARVAARPYDRVLRQAARDLPAAPALPVPGPRTLRAPGRPRVAVARFLIGPVILAVGLAIGASPADPTPRTSIMEFHLPTNPFVYGIGACALAAVTLLIERTVRLRDAIYLPRGLSELLDGLRGQLRPHPEKVEQEALAQDSPLSQGTLDVLASAKSSRRGLARVAESAADRAAARAERNTDILGMLVQLAPLCGLAGSLYSMIITVGKSGHAGNPQALSTGFLESLTATLLGLAVAAPCIVFHALFLRRGRDLHDKMLTRLQTLAAALRRPNPSNGAK
jgi:biopolymer transport protein ExbB/TolQ